MHPSATPIWAPTGISLAALLVFGRRLWPAVALGAFLVNFSTFGSWETSVAIAIGNTLEALAGALLTERLARGTSSFERGRDSARFVLVAGMLSTLVSPLVGVTSLSAAGYAKWSDYGSIWLTWWLGDVSGNLVVAPFLILWLTERWRGWRGRRALEASTLLLATGVLGVLAIFPWPALPASPYPAAFLAFPLILWAAFRFGPRGTATVVLLVSAMAVWSTLNGRGPFAMGLPNRSLMLLDLFLVVASFTGLAVAAVVHERESTAEALRDAECQLQQLLRRERGDREHAQASSRAKDEFLAVLGHELRSPLAALSHAAEALQRPAEDESRVRRLLGIIGRQTRYLAHLVDDLLDVSRLDSGKIRLMTETIDLREIVERCLASLAEAGTLQDRIVLPDLRPAWVRADPTRIHQVVSNLLDNAIKFTAAGGRIDVAVTTIGDQAVLEIKDDGRGIDSGTLPRIFDFFSQGEDALDRSHGGGGLGIGLTIVRRLAELHGGSVEARSEGAGSGSEFVVRLPLHAVAPLEVPASEAAAAAVAPSGLRVLVIEDYEDSRAALEACLGMLGHAVETAEDGIRGLEIAREWRPDVALVDIGLPGLSGYEVAKTLRALDPRGEILLLAITGYDQEEVRRRALQAGFDDCLVKPVNPELLTWLLSARTRAAAVG